MRYLHLLLVLTLVITVSNSCRVRNKAKAIEVSDEEMRAVYEEVKTPFKYGVVFQHPDSTKLIDSPTIFRKDNMWYMTYIVFDGQGYETWLAESADLIDWESRGTLLSFTQNTWDTNQKAGYMALVDYDWGGNYEVSKYTDSYWMTYLGGNSAGYEAGTLKVGLASSALLTDAQLWNRAQKPILSPDDKNARWFENKTIYKSLVIRDTLMHTGHLFVMYYNAKGKDDFESIGMAVSDDMVSWKRFGKDPVISRGKGICGDAQIAKYGDIYIMFYFG
ncbi:MAG: glycosylase, partial [Bacteroidota bacterium]